MPLQMLKAHETLSATLNDAHKCARLHPLNVCGHTPPATRLDEYVADGMGAGKGMESEAVHGVGVRAAGGKAAGGSDAALSAHLAGEATVAALGAFAPDPREFRVVCVASDGESRRGTAFAMEYMKQELSRDSPIHAHVGSLELMNLLVGDDDITPDTDFKHAFKCLRSLAMRDAGIDILGVHISVATLRQHLLANGLTPKQVNAYLNPNDKQDVPLLYRFLRAIWSLPPAPDSSPPLFVQARNALRVFGKLAHNLVMPYISLDMNLRLGPRHRS
ncbi:hypothetical protein B0H14DRAFT_3428255 [Mycena olivaceomarginata]|nr:hypothetical protein B0H14DRAFT_3428255 [Mycena olivaceomarginata]